MKSDNKKEALLEAYFKEWQQTAEKIRAQVIPVFKAQKNLQKALKPMIDTFQKTLGPILAEQKRVTELTTPLNLPRIEFPGILKLAEKAVEFQKLLQEHVNSVSKQLQSAFHELPIRTQKALLLLGEHGWYLDLEMPFQGLWELKDDLLNGKEKEAEEELIEYFEGRLYEIEQFITEKFPHRAHLIKSAFNAHRRKEYELSIPVLLAQTDGICKEAVDQYLFIKNNKKPSTAIYVEQIVVNTYRAALLSPLAKTLPISASKNERTTSFNELNRHTVMHGESLDYGTKINSLKAISLINYVAHVLKT